MLNGDPGVFRTILDAAARLPAARLVLTVGDLGPLPANAVVNQAPQLPLLGRASLTVTHAGLNTVLESLARGVPRAEFESAQTAEQRFHRDFGGIDFTNR